MTPVKEQNGEARSAMPSEEECHKEMLHSFLDSNFTDQVCYDSAWRAAVKWLKSRMSSQAREQNQRFIDELPKRNMVTGERNPESSISAKSVGELEEWKACARGWMNSAEKAQKRAEKLAAAAHMVLRRADEAKIHFPKQKIIAMPSQEFRQLVALGAALSDLASALQDEAAKTIAIR